MKVYFDNVDLNSCSGPNSFAGKLVKYMAKDDHIPTSNIKDAAARLCFIESHIPKNNIPLIQRLDGIYFNLSQDYKQQNQNIKKTYHQSDGVVFQTEFNKQLITKYFGPHQNSIVIPNGADIELIDQILPLRHSKIDKYENIWSCASHWRPHKRLDDNIEYFLQHAGPRDCLLVAGKLDKQYKKNSKIIYLGEVDHNQLVAVYKASKYFIHLAWLDHCPNVVVDARASGCQVICTSAGGTKEIAGLDAIIVEEDIWDFAPVELYKPPELNFKNKIKNSFNSDYNMLNVMRRYVDFIRLNLLE